MGASGRFYSPTQRENAPAQAGDLARNGVFMGFDRGCGGLEAFWRGLYPVKTAQCIAAALHAPPRTVEKWLDGTSVISMRWYLRALIIWGPDFLLASFDEPPAWVDRAAALQERQRLEQELAQIETRLRQSDLHAPERRVAGQAPHSELQIC